MKRFLSLALTAACVLGCMASLPLLSASAEESAERTLPDWIITEIGNDTTGVDMGYTNGYTGGADVFEFIELYNASDRTLDLYDYALIYNGHGRGNANFENMIIESTPIKPGDFWDGGTFVPTSADIVYGDFSNKPVNPDTCEVAPGEVVVLWMMYYESYLAIYNEGKGVSIEDFRAHWNVPEDVKVIAVDANGTAKAGGHSQNFNVKNSETGTYGIALQSDELNSATNGEDNVTMAGSFCENSDIAFWATVDFIDQIPASTGNRTHHFTWDFGGYAAHDEFFRNYMGGEYYTYDARRAQLLSAQDAPSVGTLNVLQKATLGVALEVGESYTFDPNIVYYPFLTEEIYGFLMGDTVYKDGETFTADRAGMYRFDYSFSKEQATEPDTLPATEPMTEPETDPVTEIPTTTETEPEPMTGAVTEPEPTTDSLGSTDADTEAPADGGCASTIAPAMLLLPLLLLGGAAVSLRRKD